MATEYLSFMFAYSEDELIIREPLTSDMLNNDNEIIELMLKKIERNTVLQSLSRYNRLFSLIQDIYDVSDFYDLNEFKCLEFLTKNWAILNPSQLNEVADSFENMFKLLKEEPEVLVKALRSPLAYNEIVKAIEIATPTFNPDTGSDGDDILYLMVYLVSVKHLLQEASKNNCSVIFFSPQLMWESEE